jgi:hypothetical protein
MSDALTDAQLRLMRGIDRARIGEGEGLATLVREEGLRFANLFSGLVRMIRVHALSNAAFDRPIADFSSSCGRLLALVDVVHLVAVEDQLYINDIRLRFETGSSAEGLGKALHRRKLGGLDFEVALEPAVVRGMLAAFSEPVDAEDPAVGLVSAFARHKVSGVAPVRPLRFKLRGEGQVGVEALRDARGRTIDETWSALGTGKAPNTLGLRKMVLDLATSEETDFLWSEATDTPVHLLHCMRVAGLAMCLGRAVGLSEGRVEDLGLTGLLHDVGYAAREEVALGLGLTEGDEGRPPPKERHHTAAVRLLARQRGYQEAKVLRLLGILEHHEDAVGGRHAPSLFGRILRICDDYDNLVRRGGGWISPAVALEHMVALEKAYDPVLLQLFVNLMGQYPPGTVLELKDGRQVRSTSFARSPQTWARPLVYVYRENDGSWPRERVVVDLSRTGRVVRVVEKL